MRVLAFVVAIFWRLCASAADTCLGQWRRPLPESAFVVDTLETVRLAADAFWRLCAYLLLTHVLIS
eukprot:SAG31_NODE_503_length_14804_cov_32.491670_4_plen_66_part_00